MATAWSDVYVDFFFAEDVAEPGGGFGGGGFERQLGYGVVEDEVYVGAELLGEVGELVSVLEFVVYAVQEDVFDSDFAVGLLEVVLAGFDYVGDG